MLSATQRIVRALTRTSHPASVARRRLAALALGFREHLAKAQPHPSEESRFFLCVGGRVGVLIVGLVGHFAVELVPIGADGDEVDVHQ